MKRCPHCNGKLVPLQKQALFDSTRGSLKFIKVRQLFRCKRCKKEMEL
ncbi:hypothetical protein LCGC14_3007420 [marine sediment metagenome]|uniref:Transposase IS204/IS1001/IS1096/IS1165 zinc-finger domain-containing protein n=1 Tax=marine sediment metagenome TaxID=412755 RepID=A0A0F8WZP2_9ZZZZ